MAGRRKIAITATELFARLSEIKDLGMERGEHQWWKGTASAEKSMGKPVIVIDFANVREKMWISMYYNTSEGVTGSLVIHFIDEKVYGTVRPFTEEGLTKLRSQMTKKPKFDLTKREFAPASLCIKKYSIQVIENKDSGNIIYPEDEYRSDYYCCMALINEIFVSETEQRIDDGRKFFECVMNGKKQNKTATEINADFIALIGRSRFNGDVIIPNSELVKIKNGLSKDSDILLRGIIEAPANLSNLIQINTKSGDSLINPSTRINIKFDANSGEVLNTKIFDGSKPFKNAANQTRYEEGRVDGESLNINNIHEFFPLFTSITGVVEVSSVCISKIGLSVSLKLEKLIVKHPTGHEEDDDDIFESFEKLTIREGAAAAENVSTEHVSAAAAEGTTPVEDEDNLSDSAFE